MIRHTLAALAAAVFSCLFVSSVQASPHADGFNTVTRFCGDRVCGYTAARAHRNATRVHKSRAAAHQTAIRVHQTAERAPALDPVRDAGPPAASMLVTEARRYIGTNPGGWRHPGLWCAEFMNLVLRRTGYRGTGSALASDFARYGRRIPGPRVGAIAVMWRGSGGHVGVVSGVDSDGDPIIISGNHGPRGVGESAYPRGRVYAYVMP